MERRRCISLKEERVKVKKPKNAPAWNAKEYLEDQMSKRYGVETLKDI